ncbi:MAG: outer membrane protein assembly factor BamC [Thioalkalispiraceae bacterium]|jgi:outer membrane protein assembly factor BamC
MKFNFSFVIVALLLLTSCSSTAPDYKGVYESTADIRDLTVPPDLDKPVMSKDSILPELQRSIKTYSSYEENIGAKPTASYAQNYSGMRFVRSGSIFWLEIDAPGSEIWGDIRRFFIRLGFKIKKEQPRIGYLETDWLENRINTPTNFLSEFLGSLFSSGLMDKYRVRLEWDEKKKVTRLFINHQGLKEVAVSGDDNISVVETRWEPRKSDPNLEIEMLTRFMAFRGLDEKVAEQQVASAKPVELTKLEGEGDKTTLTINEPFARAWRRVSIALDRLGYLVEDKNRTAGIYYVKIPETFEIPKQGGLFGTFFTDTQKPTHYKYLIILEEKEDATVVTIKSNGDIPKEMPVVANKMLKDIESNIL